MMPVATMRFMCCMLGVVAAATPLRPIEGSTNEPCEKPAEQVDDPLSPQAAAVLIGKRARNWAGWSPTWGCRQDRQSRFTIRDRASVRRLPSQGTSVGSVHRLLPLLFVKACSYRLSTTVIVARMMTARSQGPSLTRFFFGAFVSI